MALLPSQRNGMPTKVNAGLGWSMRPRLLAPLLGCVEGGSGRRRLAKGFLRAKLACGPFAAPTLAQVFETETLEKWRPGMERTHWADLAHVIGFSDKRTHNQSGHGPILSSRRVPSCQRDCLVHHTSSSEPHSNGVVACRNLPRLSKQRIAAAPELAPPTTNTYRHVETHLTLLFQGPGRGMRRSTTVERSREPSRPGARVRASRPQ